MTRRIGDMDTKQIVGTVAAAFIIAVCSILWIARDTTITNERTLAERTELIKSGETRISKIESEVAELKRKQGLSDLESTYSKQDREEFKDLLKDTEQLLSKVDKSLTSFEVKIDTEITTIKKSIDDLNSRMDDAGI